MNDYDDGTWYQLGHMDDMVLDLHFWQDGDVTACIEMCAGEVVIDTHMLRYEDYPPIREADHD